MYFLKKDGQEDGPFPVEQLQQLAADRQLQPHDTVRREDEEKWILASEIDELHFPSRPSEKRPSSAPDLEPAPLLTQATNKLTKWALWVAAVMGFMGDFLEPLAPFNGILFLIALLVTGGLLYYWWKEPPDRRRDWDRTFPQKPLQVSAQFLAAITLWFVLGCLGGDDADRGFLGNHLAAVAGIQDALFDLRKEVAEVKQDTSVIRKDTAQVRQDTGQLRKDTTELRRSASETERTTGEIRDDTAEIKETTARIDSGIQQIGRLGGLIADPKTATDFFHNAGVYGNRGDTVEAIEALEEYFKRETRDYIDPYQKYWRYLRKEYSDRKAGRLLQLLCEDKPQSKSARLTMILHESADDLDSQIRALVTEVPDYLPAYAVLCYAMPSESVIDLYEQSLVCVAFNQNGGYERLKDFYLDPQHEDLGAAREFGMDEPFDPSQCLKIMYNYQPHFQGMQLVFVDQKRAGRELVISFDSGAVTKIPLAANADDPATGFAVVELSMKGDGRIAYQPRRSDDVRVYPHCGYLTGVEPGPLRFEVEYVDWKGRSLKLPQPTETAIPAFTARVAHGAETVQFMRPGPPKLQIHSIEFLQRCEIASQREGPYAAAGQHMSVPTIREIPMHRIPGFDGKPGMHTFWIKGQLYDSDVTLGPEPVPVMCPDTDYTAVATPSLAPPPEEKEETCRELARLEGHTMPVYDLAFTSRKNLLASAGDDKTARLWNSQTRKLEKAIPEDDYWVRSLAFTSYGNTLVTGCFTGQVKMWDVTTGHLQQTMDLGLPGVHTLAVSPSGSRLAASYKSQVAIWDLHMQKAVTKLDVAGPVVFSTNGQFFATGGSEQKPGAVNVWKAHDAQLQFSLDGEDRVRGLVFAGSSELIAGTSGQVVVWNLATQRPRLTLDTPGDAVAAMGSLLATGGSTGIRRGVLVLWDLASGEQRENLRSKVLFSSPTKYGLFDPIRCLAFSPNGELLASNGRDNTIILWDMQQIAR